MPESDKSAEHVGNLERQKRLVAEDPGTSGTQEAGPPIEPEVLKPAAATTGLWGTELMAALNEAQRGLRPLARTLLSFVLLEIRRKDREIDGLRTELKETSQALANERIAHVRAEARLNAANITPAMAFGPTVAGLGIAVYQKGLPLYGGSLVFIGLLWLAWGVQTWWMGK
jgi:hypothetical protein